MSGKVIKVEMKGVDKTLRQMRRMGGKVAVEARKAVSASALVGVNYGKQHAPVDKNFLRPSIQVLDKALDGLEVSYGSRLQYAAVNDERHATKAGYLSDSESVAFEDLRKRTNRIRSTAKL